MASLTLFNQFGLSRDADGDSFAEEEVPGFKDLFHFVSRVVVDYDQHGIGLLRGVLQGTMRP